MRYKPGLVGELKRWTCGNIQEFWLEQFEKETLIIIELLFNFFLKNNFEISLSAFNTAKRKIIFFCSWMFCSTIFFLKKKLQMK